MRAGIAGAGHRSSYCFGQMRIDPLETGITDGAAKGVEHEIVDIKDPVMVADDGAQQEMRELNASGSGKPDDKDLS